MILKEKVSRGSVETNHLDLSITTPEPTIIEIGRGRFTVASVEYDLDDEVQCSLVGSADYETDVRGFLALNAEGALEVVVDECILDGIDVGFTFNDSPYRLLSKLFACRLPAGPVDLTNVEVRVTRMIAPEPKPKLVERVLNPEPRDLNHRDDPESKAKS